MSSKTPLKVQSTSPMGPDSIVRCHHGEQVDRLTSHTIRNPGREFYICSRPQSERCGFWFWVDDPIFAIRSPQTTPPQVVVHPSTPSLGAPIPSNGLCTPRPSPLHSTSNPAVQSTPPKRRCPEGFATDPRSPQTSVTPTSKLAGADTPNKRARLEAIQAGLQARLQDETPHKPSRAIPEQPDALPFTHGVETNEPTSAPSPASETTTDVEQEVEPRVRYSFLGLPPTQESEEPSTPKKRPSSISDGKQNILGHRGDTSSSALLTPPQSTNRIEVSASTASGSGSSRPEPVTPTRHKGKERASAEWDQLVEAEDNPFVDKTSPFKSKLEADAFQRALCSPRPSLDSQEPSCTPTIAERIVSNITLMRDALRMYADNFDQLGAAKYIERIERQKNALTLGEEAKKKLIAALVAERDEYKEKYRQSEERCRAKDEIIASLSARR